MKELSIEQKAKAYDEAISMAEKFYTPDSNNVNLKATLEMIFPELSESEDEKIRKELINYFEHHPNIIVKRERKSDWIAWLEKQGEQKPSEDEDREYACQLSEHYTQRELMIYNLGIADGKRMIEDAIKETEQKPAWSEEDEEMFEHIIAKATLHFSSINYLDEEEINFLKSLSPQSHWKPTEEQMDALESAVSSLQSTALESLYRNLKGYE